MDLSDLGTRICVIGQLGSGKSTLAEAIGRRMSLPVVHLDQHRHQPGTRFEVRPDEEFHALHDAAIADDRWVIEGNYSRLLPHRLERATGLILLDISTPRSLLRYARRTLRSGTRTGGLGIPERLSWSMTRFIVISSASNRARRLDLFSGVELPKILVRGARASDRFWKSEGLARGSPL